ncbi:transport protein TRS120 [Wolffia australiana]
MEPDVSMETASTIRVAVLPIGGPFSADQFRDYASMLVKHRRVDLSSISTFYMEHQKSPFAHQPWETGGLRFQFIIGGSPASPWEDFQPNRKILAVVGICHCPSSPDLALVSEQFTAACKDYASSLVERCFAFCPSDAQLGDKSNKDSRIILFPPSDRKTQEFHMLTMVQDLAASLLMEFEKWVLSGESSGTILKTPLDSQASLSSEEFIKAKKKRLGRAQKTIGDYCLLAGSAVDANDHYTTAIELARLTGDVFWHAGALEGSVAAMLVDRMDSRDPALEEEVKYRYYTVIQLYRRSFIPDNSHRVSTVSFELEAALKLARFLCRQENAKEVVDLLMGAAEGAKSLIDASDRLILYIEIARIFGTLGYQRKAAFFSRQVAQLYLQQDSAFAAVSAMKVLSLASKAYRIQSKKADTENSTPSRNEGGKWQQVASIVALFESQWSNLQMILLREVLMSSVRAGDPLAAWSAAARLLRSHYPLITPAGQAALASSLSASAAHLPRATHSPDPALPFVRLHAFLPAASMADIVERSPGKEWWQGSAPSGPFIYTPFSRGSAAGGARQVAAALTWVVGEPVQVLVELANPCAFDLTVDSIRLRAGTGNLDAFPVRVRLAPNSAKLVPLAAIPTAPGPVSIPGCVVRCFGVVTEHLFRDVDSLLLGAAQGLVLSDPFRACGAPRPRPAPPPPAIAAVPPLPLLAARLLGGGAAAVLYEGELRELSLRMTNAGTVPVVEAHVSLSGKNQDSVVALSPAALLAALPLAPGAEASVPLTVKAWQLGGGGAACPAVVVHYGGPREGGAPGRRLAVPVRVSVCRGLRFVKARLLAMEIPARVGEEEQGRGLVKMNPNRGSWGLRLLELELANPTDEPFEVSVLVQPPPEPSAPAPASATRIDRDCAARVLIPLEHVKLPVIDGSFFSGERSARAEVDACVRRLLSRIHVAWRSGRSGRGELSFKDAAQAAVQASVMDVLLPDPLTFVFRLRRPGGAAFSSGDLVPLDVLVRNNTDQTIKLDLTVSCRDVAGNDCVAGDNPTVLWAGVMSGIGMEVPALGETAHPVSLYFMVPGEYTLLGSAVIDEPTDMIRTRAQANSPDEPIYCRGSPFHLHVRAAV